MKKMVMVGVVSVVLTGCANMGQLGGGRYLQQVSPMTDSVVVQIDSVTDKVCTYMMSGMSPEEKQFYRCSSQSEAKSLPWRAVFFNPSFGGSFVIDANAYVICMANVAVMEAAAEKSKSGAKVTMPCTEKAAS